MRCLGVFVLLAALLAPKCSSAEPPGFANSLVYPLLTPRISSDYGLRNHPIYHVLRKHRGIDLAAPLNAHVRAVASGVVIYSGEWGGYGKLVSILHPGNRVSMYGHLYDVRINIGDQVTSGQIIGRVGSTGKSTGPHLHFEWRENGRAVDPLTILPGMNEPAAW